MGLDMQNHTSNVILYLGVPDIHTILMAILIPLVDRNMRINQWLYFFLQVVKHTHVAE